MIWGGAHSQDESAQTRIKKEKRVQRGRVIIKQRRPSWQIPDDVRSRCGVADLTRQNGRSVGVCVDANAGIPDAWEMLDLNIEAAKVSDMQCRRCDVMGAACRCSRLLEGLKKRELEMRVGGWDERGKKEARRAPRTGVAAKGRTQEEKEQAWAGRTSSSVGEREGSEAKNGEG